MDKSKAALSRIESMRMDYARQLPGKIRRITEEWSRLKERGWDTDVVKELVHQSHGMAGVAATFGFAEVSARALVVDVFLAALLENADTPTDDQWQRIGELMADLEKATPE